MRLRRPKSFEMSALMSPEFAEFIGTTLLILLGDGVVANILLHKTKGHDSGWIVICFGWGMAVFIAAFITAPASGAHLNPAVTLSLALAGKFAWGSVPLYVCAQLLGAALGAVLVWLYYRQHFEATSDANAKLSVFCTGPAIRGPLSNLISEAIGTFVLVYAALHITDPEGRFAAINTLPIGFVVLGIGLSLGGSTGYAINPARDLGPRLVHSLLPISGKRDSDWSYAWVPVVGPCLGGMLAAILFRLASSPG